MGKVYLLADEEWSQFKIGVTKNSSSSRVKGLQTGNGSEIMIVKEYESDNYRRIESYLHRLFANKRLVGEWFKLDDDDIINFTKTCIKEDDKISFLKEHNVFYK